MEGRGWRSSVAGLMLPALLLAAAPRAVAIAEEEKTEATLEARIHELERRVADLESALRKALDSSAAAELQRRLDLVARELEKLKMGEAAATRELTSVHGLGPAASKVYGAREGVSIGGYGEFAYQDFDARRDDGARTGARSVADMLRAVLYFGYKFDDRIVFNSEIEFEHATTGEGAEEKGEVSVEFATLDFLLSRPANIRAGLVLMPMGFINEMHEPTTFLGARRPEVETRIIPSTWREMGVGLFGDAGPVAWRAYVVSGLDAEGFTPGNGLREGRQSGSNASARDLAFVARADFHGLAGLLAGASVYAGQSGQGAETAAGRVIEGRIDLYEVHVEYAFRGFRGRALWAAASVDDADAINRTLLGLDPSDPAMAAASMGSRLTGWYAEAGYDVLSWMGERTRQAVIPYARYERYDTQERVPAGFASDGSNDARVLTWGVAYKPISNLAIKVDYQDFDRADGSGTDRVNAALGYIF